MKLPKIYSRARKNLVTTIEASKFHNDKMTMPEFNGMHTVKNINPTTSDDLFYFHAGLNVIEGYVESSGASYLNLIDGAKKLVKPICNSFYHSIMDDMSEILYALELYPDHDLIIDISDIYESLHREGAEWDFFNFFVQALLADGVKVKLVQLKKYEIIYIDNFKVVAFIYESGQRSNLIHEFFKKRVTDSTVEPTKNVLVSRGAIGVRPPYDAEGLSHKSDERMDDHEALETYFADLGYDIVHAEKFSSFQQQLDYFYSVKTLVSLTGSGLTNAAFMQPGGIMFEIVTPLVVSVPFPDIAKDLTDPFYVQEIHNFYKNLAYYQNHTFACVQNPSRSVEEFKKAIDNAPGLKKFLDRND
jgi:hypothetical protein